MILDPACGLTGTKRVKLTLFTVYGSTIPVCFCSVLCALCSVCVCVCVCVLGSYMRLTSWTKVDMWLKKGFQSQTPSGPLPRDLPRESHYIPLDTNTPVVGCEVRYLHAIRTPQQTHQSIKHNSSRDNPVTAQSNIRRYSSHSATSIQSTLHPLLSHNLHNLLPADMLLHIYTVKNRDAATVYDSFTELDLTYYTYKDDQAGQGTWQV